MVGALVVLALASAVNHLVGQPVYVLLLGLLFGYAASSLTTVLMASSPAQGLQRYVVWSFGSFAVPPGPLPGTILLLAVVTVVGLSVGGPRLDALLLGRDYAESSGIHARRTQGLLILVAGILTGLVTAVAGPISFLGVAAPHVARGWVRSSRHRVLVPATAVLGATIALVADLVARLPGSSRVLPLNAVLALVGVPVVVVVLVRGHRSAGAGLGL
jgi:iron complex transport system permease protein